MLIPSMGSAVNPGFKGMPSLTKPKQPCFSTMNCISDGAENLSVGISVTPALLKLFIISS